MEGGPSPDRSAGPDRSIPVVMAKAWLAAAPAFGGESWPMSSVPRGTGWPGRNKAQTVSRSASS